MSSSNYDCAMEIASEIGDLTLRMDDVVDLLIKHAEDRFRRRDRFAGELLAVLVGRCIVEGDAARLGVLEFAEGLAQRAWQLADILDQHDPQRTALSPATASEADEEEMELREEPPQQASGSDSI